MKAIVGRDDDSILGFTMIGDEAGKVKAAMQTAIAILAHPTMEELRIPL